MTDCDLREEQTDAPKAAVEAQDDDFHALLFMPSFSITVPDIDAEMREWHNPSLWDFSDDEADDARLRPALLAEVREALRPWLSHYHSLGFMRADFASFAEDGVPFDNFVGPQFLLVYRASEDDLGLSELAELPPLRAELASIPGSTLEASILLQPVNGTMAFEAMLQGGMGAGQWEGETTLHLAPEASESRDEWLARVSAPRRVLERIVETQNRSGGNLKLFKAVGAASGQVARERPIEWIVPGLIPKSYVTLLVGAKGCGKSTLLGEMVAVVDSKCQSPRHLLGTEITARGCAAFVSGEDGEDIVSTRNQAYEPVHGAWMASFFDAAVTPWAEVLELLHAMPRVDLICIDGLRAVMSGDEDSSSVTSGFLDELVALARLKNCAVVLIHHTKKKHVRAFSAMLEAIRGSTSIGDRVRMIIGVIDRGRGVSEVGIVEHNIPPSENLWGEKHVGHLFWRNADTLTLVPLGEARPANDESKDDTPRAAVLDAIRHFNTIGATLRRTGKHELFAQRFPPLARYSRNAIRDAVADLIEAGESVDGPEGLRAARCE